MALNNFDFLNLLSQALFSFSLNIDGKKSELKKRACLKLRLQLNAYCSP